MSWLGETNVDARKVNKGEVVAATQMLLKALGYDIAEPGLKDTPGRVARMWAEFIEHDGGKLTTFEERKTDQMVIVTGMRVWSMCEHHLLPFWCDVSIAYIPDAHLLGLSKFARIAHACAHKLQLQERLVEEIAATVMGATQSRDVAVAAQGEHLCMTMRGVQTPARMITSKLHGRFFHQPEVRAEFMSLIASR